MSGFRGAGSALFAWALLVALQAFGVPCAATASATDADGGPTPTLPDRFGNSSTQAASGVSGIPRLLQAASRYRTLGGYQQLLRPRQLHRALYLGDVERIRRFVWRMAEREAVTVALLGGSISKGMGAVAGEPSLERWLRQWLAAVVPAAEPVGGAAGGGGGGGADSGGTSAFQSGDDRLAGGASWEGRSSVRLVNAACPATSSAYMNMCLREYLPDDVDLVVVEYAINDMPFPDPLWENEPRKSFEQLLRKLLRLPKRPAVVLLNTYRWHTDFRLRVGGRGATERFSEGLYYTNTESQFFELATYYGLQMLSVKAAVYQQMLAGVRGFQVHTVRYLDRQNASSDPEALFYEDPLHPSGLTGHKAMSELVTGLLLQVARGLAVRPWRQSEMEQVEAPLPGHMIPDNVDSELDLCVLGNKLRAAAVETKGFEWLNEGRSPQAPKWGFTATSAGASVTLSLGAATSSSTPPSNAVLNPTAATAPAAGNSSPSSSPSFVLVVLAHLRSYENMGIGNVTCSGECVCGERAQGWNPSTDPGAAALAQAREGGSPPEVAARLDGHWEERSSQLQLSCFPAVLLGPPEGCRVTVTVAADTRSGSHKVKIGGLIVSHTAPDFAQTMCIENLEAAQRAAGFRDWR